MVFVLTPLRSDEDYIQCRPRPRSVVGVEMCQSVKLAVIKVRRYPQLVTNVIGTTGDVEDIETSLRWCNREINLEIFDLITIEILLLIAPVQRLNV